MGPWILAAVGACRQSTNGGPPLGPPGEPGESRLLGTEQWRVPQGAVGLAWRGEDLLVAAKEVLVTVGADGLPQRDRLPTRASTLAVRGEEVVIGTSDGDLMRVGDRLRLDGDPGWIVAVDIGPDGATIAALNQAPRPAPPRGTHVRYPEVGRVALFAGDGRRLQSWTIERCRPQGLVHLGRNLLVGCGSYPTAVVDLGDSSVVRVKQVADRVSRSIDGAYAVTSGRDGYAVWRAGARRRGRDLPAADRPPYVLGNLSVRCPYTATGSRIIR